MFLGCEHERIMSTPLPPLAGLVLVVFDQKIGYDIAWQRSNDVRLEGIEYKCLPSGLHELDKDLVYFVHEDAYLGFSAYRRGEADASERGARFLAIGILVDIESDAGNVSGYATQLENAAERLLDSHNDMGVLEQLWDEHRAKGHISADQCQPLGQVLRSLTPCHPVRGMLDVLDVLGPLLFPLHRAALLRKRILVLGSPPVRASCEMVYALSMLSDIPLEIIEDVLQDTTEARARARTRRLFNIGIHEIDRLSQEKEASALGWVACTTDAILEHKTELWDILVHLPNNRYSRWPRVRMSGGKTVRATQRDLKRYSLLRSEIERFDVPPAYSDQDEEEVDEDLRPLLRRRSSHARVKYESAGEEGLTEPVTWSSMAYNGFVWWASAGEQVTWENEDEVADRLLSSHFPELLATISSDSSQAWRTAMMMKSYCDHNNSLVLRTLGHVIANADDATEEGFEDESITITDGVAKMMGFNSWHEGDREYIIETARVWFGREAQVQRSEMRICGMKIC